MRTIDAVESVQICNKVSQELTRSINKHCWEDYNFKQMLFAIRCELQELAEAIEVNNLTDDHGAFTEASHVACTAQKLMLMVIRRGES